MTGPARLGPVDLVDLAIEDADTPMNVGLLLRLDRVPPLADLRTTLAARAADLPRLRQWVDRPFLNRPLWTEDPAFRIERHVAQVTVPAPGDEAARFGDLDVLMRAMDREWTDLSAAGSRPTMPTGR